MSNRLIERLKPVSFNERLAVSQNFSPLFRAGMKLVEDTAAYLDGPGRSESKLLGTAASRAYATESMRLTTRLMHLASWLLLHRAVNEGEISLAQACKERRRVNLPPEECPDDPPPGLPARLHELVVRSRKLIDRVRRLDATLHAAPAARTAGNPCEFQLGMLRAAFERRQP
jgi:regulator of CtrA degradation